MGEDEEGTIRTLKAHLEVISGFIQQHRGRVVATGGDSILAEFPSVVDAVRCAVAIQGELKERNKEVAEIRRLEFRIGINLGDVVEEGDTILGDGVNIAARLESLSEAGGICISGTVFDQVRNKLDLGYEFLGEQTVKNIALPVRAYKVLLEPDAVGKVIGENKPKPEKWGWKAIAGVVVMILVAGGLVWNFYGRSPQTERARVEKMAFPLPDKPSIAVLPFANLSGDPKQEFFSDGITEDIITALSKNPEVFVIARNSTFTYKGKPVEVKQVSEELGVRYVLEGSVRRSGDQVRITAQLIDALKGHNLWAERYERDLKDIFALQDEVTLKILMALQVKLTEGGQASTAEKHFKGKEGLECYLKVIECSYYQRIFSIESNNKSRQIAEEIVSKWPGNPFGYLLLGWAYRFDLMRGSSMAHQESFKKVMELAQKALTIDESLSSAHSLLSHIYIYKREFDKAIAEGERAVALDPNGANAYEHYAHSLLYANRFKEAIPAIQKAIRLNPIGSTSAYSTLGDAYANTGRFEEAVSAFKQALLMSPDNLFAHLGLASTYIEMGREKEARAEAAEVLRIYPKFSLDNHAMGLPFKDQSTLDKYIGNLRKAGLK